MLRRDKGKLDGVYDIPSIDSSFTLGQNLRLGHHEEEGL